MLNGANDITLGPFNKTVGVYFMTRKTNDIAFASFAINGVYYMTLIKIDIALCSLDTAVG